jgi:hypothetical protein
VSGFTDDGTGFNGSDGSRERAELIDQTATEAIILADLAEHGDTICCTRRDKYGVIVTGGAQRTGLGHETYSGTRSRLHDPTHVANNGRSRVVKLAERHARENYYCLPGQEGDRETVPFRGNKGRPSTPPPKPDQSTLDAAERLEAYATKNESILWPERIDFADLRKLIEHVKG